MKREVRAYIKERARLTLLPLIYLSIAAVVITFVCAYGTQKTEYGNSANYYAQLQLPLTVLIILSYVTPVFSFRIFKCRRNLDCLFALPISRRALAVIHYFVGLIILLVPFSLSYLTNFLLLLRYSAFLELEYTVPCYFLCVFACVVMYTVFVFVFNEGNTVGDGIWLMLLWTFICACVAGAINVFVEEILGKYNRYSYTVSFGIIFYCIWSIVQRYNLFVIGGTRSYDVTLETIINYQLLWLALAVAAFVLFLLFFDSKRTEKTEEITDSYFGFRVLVPLYAITGMMAFEVWDEPIFWAIIEALAFAGYAVYRRGLRYKRRDVIFLVSLAVFLLF